MILLQLALHSVDDCVLDHAGLCIALADAAKEHGAKIYENCEVTRVLVGDNRAVYAVDTDGESKLELGCVEL